MAAYPASLHSAASSVYLSFFLSKTASIPPSLGAVSSAIITVWAEVDHRTMSGRRAVVVFSIRNLSCPLSGSSHSGFSSNLSHWVMIWALGLCLTKWNSYWNVAYYPLFASSLRASRTSASLHRTQSCHHLSTLCQRCFTPALDVLQAWPCGIAELAGLLRAMSQDGCWGWGRCRRWF